MLKISDDLLVSDRPNFFRFFLSLMLYITIYMIYNLYYGHFFTRKMYTSEKQFLDYTFFYSVHTFVLSH